MTKSHQLLTVVQASLLGIGVLAFLGFFYWTQKAHARSLEGLAGLRDEVRALGVPGAAVELEAVEHECHSDRDSTDCTFTNRSDKRVRTCAEGLLQNKEVPALRLATIPLCSGTLAPGETRTVSAPWSGGFADDICSKENAFGKSLDFSKCSFHVATAPAELLPSSTH